MTRPDNPYDAPIELQDPAIPLRTKTLTILVGLFVAIGSLITLGAFLFAVLILVAGQTQPSPLPRTAWFDSPLQKMILGIGSIAVFLTSFALGTWVNCRIAKSQRLTAEVLFRRRELIAAVGEMQFAIHQNKLADKSQSDQASGPSVNPNGDTLLH